MHALAGLCLQSSTARMGQLPQPVLPQALLVSFSLCSSLLKVRIGVGGVVAAILLKASHILECIIKTHILAGRCCGGGRLSS